MASIEVKRIGDGSVRKFSNSEVDDGTLVNWVTENDPNADGLVRFINQANETGNATADSLSKFPKIVKDGNLIKGNVGESVVDWDGVNDGIKLSPENGVDLESNPKQSLSLKLEIEDPENLPQHLARVNGINIYEKEGKIKVTVKDPDTDYRDTYIGGSRGLISYEDSVYKLDYGSESVQRLNNSGNFESIDNSTDDFINDAEGNGITTYDGKLWVFQEDVRESIYSFTGSKQIEGHFFREDGQKLYVTDLFPDTSKIEEYTLSTAWDVVSASKETSISKSNVNGLFFRPNGEKFYAISKNNKEILEYTLSAPWSLDSAQLNATKPLSSTNNPRDLYFRDDGLKLYVGDPGTDTYDAGDVREYDLSTAWDISTLSLNQNGNIGLEGENDVNGIYFKDDGSKLFICGTSSGGNGYTRGHLWEYDLGTGWNVTTASKTKDFSLNAYENFSSETKVGTLFFKNGEEFTVTKHNGEILEYKLYENWNVRSANYKQKNVVENGKSGLSAEYASSRVDDCCFGDNGSQFYILDERKIESYSLSSAYDLSSTERDGEIYLAYRSFQSDALWVGETRAYVAKGDDILEYILHEPWDISASEYTGQKDYSGSFDSLYFKPDGTKFFGINKSQRVVRELELSTSWDITTGSQIRTYNPNSNPPSAEAQLRDLGDIEFGEGGSTMYLCDSVGSRAKYNLSTSWDLSTISFQQFVDSRDVGPPPKGESYHNLSPSTGTPSEDLIKSYVVAPSGDKSFYFTPTDCLEYSFETNFDILTENYNETYGLATANFLLNCFFKYKGDLYATYYDASDDQGGILKYDGDTFSHFLTVEQMTQIFEGDFNARELNTRPRGVGVFEGEIYFSPRVFDYNNQQLSSDRLFKYNPQDGWKQVFRFGYSTNTRSGVEIEGPLAYDGDLWLTEGAGPLYKWNKKEERFIHTSKYTSSYISQALHKIYDKQAYFVEDEIYRTDGLTQFIEDTDQNGYSIIRRNGELWIDSGGKIIKKGKSVCITHDYDKQSSEVEIKAGVTDRYLYAEVNGQSAVKNHDLDYKNDGEIDLGLSLGSTSGDGLSGVDEPYQGNISELKWYPEITGEIFKKAESDFLDITLDYTTDSSIQGRGSTDSKIEDIQKIEIKRANNQGGSFTTVEEIKNPNTKEISFKDTGLTSGEEYYYKTVLTPSFANVDPLESSVASDTAEYPKPSAPKITIRSTQPSEVSGEINSPDSEIFLDKFELYRSLDSGGSYSKVQEFTGVGNSITWTDSTVDPNKKYFYKAKAIKTDAPIESDFSGEKSTAKIEETWEDYALGETLSDISTPFTFTSGSDWYINDRHSRIGSRSLRSESIIDSETTEATINLSPDKRRQLYIQWGSDSNSYDEVYLVRNENDIKSQSGGNTSSKDVLSIPGGTTTSIKVSYRKNSTYKEFSDSAWIHHLIDAPVLPPEFSAEKVSTDKAEVNHFAFWENDIDGDFSGFHVYVDDSKVTNTPQPLGGTYTTDSLNAGDRKIKVTNVRADGVESSLKTETIKIRTITDLTVSENSNGDLQLSWNTNDPNSSYYNVYRADKRQGNYTKINSSNVTTESYTDTSAQSGEIYFYKVSSVNESGDESLLSEYASNAFTVQDGETATLSDTTESYAGFEVNGTLNIEGKVTLNISSFFEVGSSGTINGTGNGFGPGSGDHADGNGPGGGFGQSDDGGIGGSYGGEGGSAPDDFSNPPSTYGNPESAEARKGSAGGNGDGNSLGGAGGAALEVLASSNNGFSTTIDGTINFDGQQGQHDGSSSRAGGGGSGGGIYIESEITGSGTITARGGDGTAYENDGGGAGGGGRLKALSFGPDITTDVSGGSIPSGGDGEPGNDGTVAGFITTIPENLGGSYDSDTTEINLSWETTDPSIEYYNVYRSTSSNSGFSKVNSSDVSSQNYTDSGVTEGTVYYYKVTSVDTDGNESDFSDKLLLEASANPKIEEDWESYDLGKTISEISTPFNFTSGSDWFVDGEYSRVGSQSLRSDDISDNQTTTATIEFSSTQREQLIIRWGSDSESGYDEVYLRRNGNEIKNLSGSNKSSKELFSIPSGTTTNIEVSYEKDGSVSSNSDSAWIHQLISASVIPPEFSTSVSSNGEVAINHSHSVGNDVDGDFNGFHVYVDGSKATNNPQPTNGTYTTSSLNQGDHTIGVANVRSDGVESFEVEKKVTIPTIINLTASKDSGEVNLSWDTTTSDSDYYNVYRSDTKQGNYAQINSSDVTTKSYTDDTIQTGETYFYKVSSVDGSGNESNLSEPTSTTFHTADYENGLGEWIANEDAFVQKTNYSFEGNASAGIQEPGSDIDNVVLGYWEAGSAMQPEMWEFFWRENSSSSGGGLRLLNSNGNYEVSFSTNNPQWVLSDGDQYNDEIKSDNGVYEDWVRVRMYFDWQNGEYDYEVKNMNTGTNRSGSGRSMENGLDIKRINLEIYNGNWFNSLPSGTGSKKTYWWQDSMYLGPDNTS